MKLRIIPTGSYVFFRKIESEKSWCKQSGIGLYDENKTRNEEETDPRTSALLGGPLVEAEVMAVGPGRLDEHSTLREPRVKTGDRVLLSRWVRPKREIIIDGQRCGLTDSCSVTAILEEIK